MSDRVDALALQALDAKGILDKHKFAELIIKETMQIVAKNTSWNGYIDAASAVILHFKIGD
jgi:hypothetical protein